MVFLCLAVQNPDRQHESVAEPCLEHMISAPEVNPRQESATRVEKRQPGCVLRVCVVCRKYLPLALAAYAELLSPRHHWAAWVTDWPQMAPSERLSACSFVHPTSCSASGINPDAGYELRRSGCSVLLRFETLKGQTIEFIRPDRRFAAVYGALAVIVPDAFLFIVCLHCPSRTILGSLPKAMEIQ